MHRDIDIFYGKTISVPEWEERWRRGSVPGQWPYSLELLAEHNFRVRTAAKPHSKISLGFDESVAPKISRSGSAGICGTIWLTDELEDRQPTLRTRARRAVLARYVARMERIVTFSAATPDLLAEHLRVSRSRVVYVPLGIDTDFYPIQEYGTEPIVLSVGNDRARDLTTLYTAYELLLTARPDITIVVQTADPRPAPPGVKRVDRFRDHAELRQQYGRSAVIAIASHPNLYTSGSTVALEAQATGRPVVITGTPGMSDYVEDGVSGFLVQPDDPAALSKRILQVLQDRGMAQRMGLAGANRVRAENSARAMIARLAAIADSIDIDDRKSHH